MTRTTISTTVRHSFAMSSTMHTSALQPRFSTGSDEATLRSKLNPLLTSPTRRWTLTAEGEALERSFKFKTFGKTWDFMTAVSLQCKIQNHHPEWSNVYNTTFIRWTTHHPKGLSEKDINLAIACDTIAQDFGELADAELASSSEMRELTERATNAAGDCCTPKK